MGLNPWEHIPVVRRRYALRFLAALAVILLIVGAFGGTIYAQTGDELESDVESQLVTSAETDADRIDIWFRSTERYLSSLPRSSAFRSDDRVAISDSLHRMNDRTAFEGAYYVDAETGAIHANAGTNAVITDDGRVTEAVDAQLSTVLKDDSQVVFSEAFETEAGRPAMLAVSDVPGESDHVVVGLVDLESLSRYMIGPTTTTTWLSSTARGRSSSPRNDRCCCKTTYSNVKLFRTARERRRSTPGQRTARPSSATPHSSTTGGR